MKKIRNIINIPKSNKYFIYILTIIALVSGSLFFFKINTNDQSIIKTYFENIIINNEYQFISNGFKANVKVSKDSFIIYTMPCDKGWKIKVNGEYVNYECIDNGLIGLKVFEGDNLIEFCFFPIGLKIELIISSVSIIIGTCLIIVYRKRRRYE